MAYQKHQWYTGEVVQATNLNHMEQGIYDANSAAEAATSQDIDNLFTGATPSTVAAVKNIILGNLARYYSDEMAVINQKTAVMTGATSSAAGTKGVVPAPAAGDQNKFIRGDGNWATVEQNDFTGATAQAGGTHGFVPAPAAGDENKFLKGDGNWAALVQTDVYTPAGSVAYANLPALSALVLGNVYDVTDAFTSTSSFTDGGGKSYPAGTNVAIVNVGTQASPIYKYDCLSGNIDLTNYYTKTEVDNKTGNLNNLTTTDKTNLVAAINETKLGNTTNAGAITTIKNDLADVEATTTATAAHAKGDYLLLNNILYKVTTAIQIGDTIAVGTNVVATNVGDELVAASSTGAGHTIQNNSGTSMTARDYLQFKGLDVSDDAVGGKTIVDAKGKVSNPSVAPEEAAMVATRAYSEDDLLIVGGTLYKATTNITSGATLAVGTNITTTTVADELAAAGESGHVIENNSGTDMTQRSKMQFKGLSVSDDSTNDRTVIDAGGKLNNTSIGSEEAAMVATKNYAKDDYIVVGGILYKTKTSITSGATLTVGTNVVITTIEDEIQAAGEAGHTIQNNSGTDMTQRDNLQFKGLSVTDDSTNNKTIVDAGGKLNNDSVSSTEATMSATKAYSEGELITVGGQLYKATTSIASGTALTVGTNVATTTLETELGAGKAKVITGTLVAASWSSNTQTVTLSGLKASSIGSVGLLNTATDAQREAAASAQIVPTTQAANALTFKCTTVPSVDIPFGVFIEG